MCFEVCKVFPNKTHLNQVPQSKRSDIKSLMVQKVKKMTGLFTLKLLLPPYRINDTWLLSVLLYVSVLNWWSMYKMSIIYIPHSGCDDAFVWMFLSKQNGQAIPRIVAYSWSRRIMNSILRWLLFTTPFHSTQFSWTVKSQYYIDYFASYI